MLHIWLYDNSVLYAFFFIIKALEYIVHLSKVYIQVRISKRHYTTFPTALTVEWNWEYCDVVLSIN